MKRTWQLAAPFVVGLVGWSASAQAEEGLAVEVQVFDDVKSCDADEVLDFGEVGRVVVAVRNLSERRIGAVTVMVKPDEALELGWYQVRLPQLAAKGATVAEFPARLRKVPASQVNLRVIVSPDEDDEIPAVKVERAFSVNIDRAMGVSRLDDVSFEPSVWRARFDDNYGAYSGWSRGLDEADNFVWFMTGTAAGGHASLESPVLHPQHNEDFIVRFEHRHEFDAPVGSMGMSGGVVELSSDRGLSWQDISAFAEVPYNGKLNQHSGVLEGRPAFVGRNPGLPGRDTVSINLGNTFQGEPVQVRFRVAVAAEAMVAGWELDNIEILGTVEVPFGAVVPHRSLCTAKEQLSGATRQVQVYLPDDLQGDHQGFELAAVVAEPSPEVVVDVDYGTGQWLEPEAREGQVMAEQVFSHQTNVVVKSGFGRVYGGQVVAAGCTAHTGRPGALPLAMLLVLFGWAGMRQRRA